MIHFKNNPGFTLIEVLLALSVMGLMLSSIYVLQGTLLQNTSRMARRVERAMQAHLFLIDSSVSHAKETKPLTLDKKIKDPQTDLVYTLKKPSEGSLLQKFKNIHVQQVTASWQENRTKRTDTIVTLVHRVPSKTSEAQP